MTYVCTDKMYQQQPCLQSEVEHGAMSTYKISKLQKNEELRQNLMKVGKNIPYNQFENIFIAQIDKHAIKEKYIRANNEPFMNKILSKAIMNRSRLRNRYSKNPNATNKYNYKRQRNYVVNLLRREKKKYYESIDPHKISDSKKFWKAVKPLFSDKTNMTGKTP